MDDFLYWLTGAIDTSGQFIVHPSSCRFRLSLLAENEDLLSATKRATGLGNVYPVRVYGSTRPRVSWEIQSKEDCSSLVRLLETYPLRTTKQVEYMVWRRAVTFWCSDEGTREERREALTYLGNLIGS
jgi:hypothetical protein